MIVETLQDESVLTFEYSVACDDGDTEERVIQQYIREREEVRERRKRLANAAREAKEAQKQAIADAKEETKREAQKAREAAKEREKAYRHLLNRRREAKSQIKKQGPIMLGCETRLKALESETKLAQANLDQAEAKEKRFGPRARLTSNPGKSSINFTLWQAQHATQTARQKLKRIEGDAVQQQNQLSKAQSLFIAAQAHLNHVEEQLGPEEAEQEEDEAEAALGGGEGVSGVDRPIPAEGLDEDVPIDGVD